MRRGVNTDKRPRVVVAGQIPPPLSGQHVAVETLLRSLQADERFEVEHLPYSFAASMEDQGRFTPAKVLQLLTLCARLVRLRMRGPIDVLVHPVGGTSTGSTIRDVTVLTLARALVRHTVVQFHGAGHGRAWPRDRRLLVRVARRAFRRADGAIVHARANAVDAEFLGIDPVFVAPHQIRDELDRDLVQRDGQVVRLLYVGHLGPHRGTPELIEAFARVVSSDPDVRLVLAGTPVGSYSAAALYDQLDRLGLAGAVEVALGGVRGREKNELFGGCDVFVFPTVFEAESFGLVLAEALMWGLPVVATDWRANAEVLDGAEAIVHPYAPDLSVELENALRTGIARLRAGTWPSFSTVNRERFRSRFCLDASPAPAVSAVASVVGVESRQSFLYRS